VQSSRRPGLRWNRKNVYEEKIGGEPGGPDALCEGDGGKGGRAWLAGRGRLLVKGGGGGKIATAGRG